ncbi:MAG: S8 family serine peptidase [Chloroflexi bacterium]|uniref:S8 family serine peptidase n=1 Tax=Candidatus Chlorohelix allophototropha TaxID=3003348 RepID=A0A8T7LVB6_9CHLR|nr:S8 family serine peptidase [Chloroflexota bacterium]WJW66706.1 S8 family serine peptidase [Chloroflexota bacterium L227-S17]
MKTRNGYSTFLRVAGYWLIFVLFAGLLLNCLPHFLAYPSNQSVSETSLDNTQHQPIPGEIIASFQPDSARILYNELRYNVIQTKGDSSYIGQRLPYSSLIEGVPKLREVFSKYGVWAADAIDPENGTYRLNANLNADVWAMLYEVQQSTQVRFAELDYPVYGFREPNDPYYLRGDQWGLAKIDAASAWDITTGSEDILIAVVDSGVAALHQDLEGKVVGGLNFIVTPPTISTIDDAGHGTFVAGVAAARGDNNYGIAGIAWGARILPIKVLNSRLQTSNAVVAMGINYATERHANIINLSLGAPERSEAVYEAVLKAYNQGVVLIGAAGNEGNSVPQYPASFDEVIAIGASNQFDGVAPFSNSGPEISLVAPGTSIFSLTWSQPNASVFGFDKGTSFSAPYGSGTVALMLSVNPSLTPSQVRNILEATADYPGAPIVQTPTTAISPTSTTALTPSVGFTTPAAVAPFSDTDTATATVPVTITQRTIAPVFSTTATPITPIYYDTRLGFGRLNAYRAVLAAQKGDPVASKRGQALIKVSGIPNPRDVVVTLTPGDTRVPFADGSLAFSNLPPGNYRLTAASSKYGLPNKTYPLQNFSFQITGNGNNTKNFAFDFSPSAKLLSSGVKFGAFVSLDSAPGGDTLYFDDTGHSIGKPFRQFWENNGGLLGLGYPISESFIENGMQVQYFERVVCEFHPEFAGTPFAVQVRRLGVEYSEKVKNNPAFNKVPEPTAVELANSQVFYWKETGHTLRGSFLKYWQDNGNWITLGLPISEPFNDGGRVVQYFEKQILELHPELSSESLDVLGALVARDYARTQGLLGPGY